MTEPAPDTMSQDVFDQNWPVIAAQVKAILAAKGKTRRRFRLVAVYAKQTGELLAEVLRTSCGPVVVYRVGRVGYGNIVGMRQGRGVLKFDVQPFTGIAHQPFQVTTRRPIHGVDGHKFHHFTITAQHIMDRDSVGDSLIFR